MTIKKYIISFFLIGISSGLIWVFLITLVPLFKWVDNYFQEELRHDISCNLDTCRIEDYYWNAVFDTTTNREYLIRGKMLDLISKSPNKLIGILNMRKSKCKIDKIGLENDTIKIRILEDEYLTEQMGTSGADCYIGETIYTLTENELIKFVRIEMEHGSHASPGIYSRNDYKNLLKEN